MIALFTIGFSLALVAALSAVAAAGFLVLGVGGHLIAEQDRNRARVISYDPSSVAALATPFAILTFALLVLMVVVYVLLGKLAQRRRY